MSWPARSRGGKSGTEHAHPEPAEQPQPKPRASGPVNERDRLGQRVIFGAGHEGQLPSNSH